MEVFMSGLDFSARPRLIGGGLLIRISHYTNHKESQSCVSRDAHNNDSNSQDSLEHDESTTAE